MPDSSSSEEHRLLAAAERLEALVPPLREDIAHLREHGRTSRRLIYAVAAVGLVLILAVTGFVFSYVHADNAIDRADDVQDYQVLACENSNNVRTAQRGLWNYVIDFSVENSKEPLTKKDRANVAQIKRVINDSLANQDCSQIGRPADTRPRPAATATPAP